MRFIDIAVATGYAAVCISLITIASPVTPQASTHQIQEQTRLDADISTYVYRVGLPFIASSTFSQLCDSVASASNSTVTLNVVMDGKSCAHATAPPPLVPIANSSMVLSLPGRQVILEASLVRSD